MDDTVTNRVGISTNFWQFKAAHFVIIIPMLVGAAGFFIGYGQWKGNQERDIQELGKRQGEFVLQMQRVTDKLSEMDQHGSQYSQSTREKFATYLLESERRMDNHEKLVAEIIPNMKEITTHMHWITEWIQAQEAAKKTR